ncbi:heavy-metal-associated domain-containing protein [Salegentibacter sp. JZCK2]|uniref:heavy-metal-associated domain-containing protein n=1 Tax=Salegentibacter tibetensis TaxID=2873600 RepID=UPI001CCF58BC|nr:heavy-metal-associated domain-containing protein [Salegentibacter tibetensis]MBZ9729376.1 heavy-metal-associated domain-containing protein [Salegentibacter tibetensis]
MKATILLEELNCGNCIEYVTKELSKIEDIHDILPDTKSSKITFTYDSEGAALEAVGILSSFRKLEKEAEFKQELKIA